MNNKDSIVIVGMARTPMGGFQGVLKDVTAPVLGSFAIRAALERSSVEAGDIDEVLMGCVLPAEWDRPRRVKPLSGQEFHMQPVAPL